MPDLTSDLARFWQKVEKTDTCWLWTDSLMTGGYGAFTSLVLKTKAAHRFAYRVFVGPIPKGTELDHTCHVEHCVHPDHLQLATKLVNQHNRKGPNRNGSSGYRNVHRRAGTWAVSITLNGEHYPGGTHATPEEANAAAEALRERLYSKVLNSKGCKKHGLTDGKYHTDARGVRHWKCRVCALVRADAARRKRLSSAFVL